MSGPIRSILIKFIQDLIVTNILTMSGADWLISVAARELTKSNMTTFPNSRENNPSCSGPIEPIIELIQDLMIIYILTKVWYC